MSLARCRSLRKLVDSFDPIYTVLKLILNTVATYSANNSHVGYVHTLNRRSQRIRDADLHKATESHDSLWQTNLERNVVDVVLTPCILGGSVCRMGSDCLREKGNWILPINLADVSQLISIYMFQSFLFFLGRQCFALSTAALHRFGCGHVSPPYRYNPPGKHSFTKLTTALSCFR